MVKSMTLEIWKRFALSWPSWVVPLYHTTHIKTFVSERLNRSFCNPARSILENRWLSKTFWAKAPIVAARVMIRATSRGIPADTTACEVLSRQKPGSYQFCVFGCLRWYTTRGYSKKKKTRATEANMSGDSFGSRSYKFWHPAAQKSGASQDLSFWEKWVLKLLEQNSSDFENTLTESWKNLLSNSEVQ